MRLGKRIPPYPLLNSALNMNSYQNGRFSFQYEMEETDDFLKIRHARIDTNHPDLIKLLNQAKLKAIAVFECSTTIFRQIVDISLEPIDFNISMQNLNGKVEISCFVYATEDIENYTSSDVQEDYQGYSFNIEKYSIFAVDDGITIKIEHDEGGDKRVSSIFSVIKCFDADMRTMKVELDDKKIKIILPGEDFNYYESLKDNETVRNIFFSIIIVPTLVYAFQEIQKMPSDTELEEVIDKYSWFQSIVFAYKKKYQIDLDFDTFKQTNPLELAQVLMDDCTFRSFQDFYTAVTTSNRHDGEDESCE